MQNAEKTSSRTINLLEKFNLHSRKLAKLITWSCVPNIWLGM